MPTHLNLALHEFIGAVAFTEFVINPGFTTQKRREAREIGLYDYVLYGQSVNSLDESRFMVVKQ